MYCPNCGAQVQGQFCPQCGANVGAAQSPYAAPNAPGAYGGIQDPPSSYLVPNILATLFCCLPLGLIGLIYSIQSQSAASAGNYELAVKHAGTAKTFFWISVISVCVLGFIYVVGAVAANA